MMYEIILQAYGWKKGWEVIFSLAGNTKHFSKSASTVAKDTSFGECAVSLCIDTYALSQIEINGQDNMGFVLPHNLTVINPDCIGILKGAPNIDIAKIFIEFLLTEENQLIWMAKRGQKYGPSQYSLNRLSIFPSVYPKLNIENLNPYYHEKIIKYDFQLASKRWNLLNDMIGAFVIDIHPLLKQAWKKIIEKDNKRLKEKFFEIPVDPTIQKYLITHWDDPVFRNRYINFWINFSVDKFKRIMKL